MLQIVGAVGFAEAAVFGSAIVTTSLDESWVCKDSKGTRRSDEGGMLKM